MDLNTVSVYRRAASRADLALAPGETLLAGGTWLFSEPLPEVTGLVDLTALGWEPLERIGWGPRIDEGPRIGEGLRIGATCTIAQLVAFAQGRGPFAPDPSWTAVPLFVDAANALLASFKIWNTATVGGNIARSYAAGAMVSLGAALDAEAIVWTTDGGERRVPVSAIPTGNGENSLAPGEVIRSIDIPSYALRSRAVLRKEALAEHGRSAAVVTGRVDEDGSAVFTVTAATLTPRVLRFPQPPTADALADAVDACTGWFTDPLGTADWRRALSRVLAERARAALEASA